jgi:hypothetical protein
VLGGYLRCTTAAWLQVAGWLLLLLLLLLLLCVLSETHVTDRMMESEMDRYVVHIIESLSPPCSVRLLNKEEGLIGL